MCNNIETSLHAWAFALGCIKFTPRGQHKDQSYTIRHPPDDRGAARWLSAWATLLNVAHETHDTPDLWNSPMGKALSDDYDVYIGKEIKDRLVSMGQGEDFDLIG